MSELADLYGRYKGLALAVGAGLILDDGSRIHDAQLISAGRPGLSSVRVLVDGTDNFIPVMAVSEVWEISPANPSQAA